MTDKNRKIEQSVDDTVASILDSYKRMEPRFRYQRLSMLQLDCKYYLRYGPGTGKYLLGSSIPVHIGVMKGLWNQFDEDKKPEWLSLQDIADYETKMNDIKNISTLNDAVPSHSDRIQLLTPFDAHYYGTDGKLADIKLSEVRNEQGIVLVGSGSHLVNADSLIAHDKEVLMTEVLNVLVGQSQARIDANRKKERKNNGSVLTGDEAKKVLGEILESERKSRSLTYPAHTGATGFFYEKPKFVAFDNSSNDCWVEEFKTATGAKKWCQGLLSTDEVNELEVGILRDRQRSHEYRKECRDIARQLNGRASGGDSDGVAYFVDKPFIVSFTEDELSDWANRFSEEEKVLGAYFSDNRIVPANFVILQRGNRIDAEQMPLNGVSFYSQLASAMKKFADDPKLAKSHSMRVMDNDSRINFTLAADHSPHFETFLHALEYSRRKLLSEAGVRFTELDCPKGYVSNILLNKNSFPVLNGKGLTEVDSLPPGVKFDENGEFTIEMEFHDGFAYDLNPHGYGFYDRVALYYPTIEEVLQNPGKVKAIQDYTGRLEVTPFDVALKFGQASRMRCPDFRMEAAKKAVVDRATDPSARAFTPEQRKAIELAADCGGYYDRPKGRDFFYDVLFCNSEKDMGNIPQAWKADVTAELRELAKGETRGEERGLHR